MSPSSSSRLRCATASPAEIIEPEDRALKERLVIIMDRDRLGTPCNDNGRAVAVGQTTRGSSGQPYFQDLGAPQGVLLTRDYETAARKVAESQIALGGYRLANLLNEAFK
ncbi:hypothetical protein G6M06_08295 [Agrobacterium rhizogenes]|nr:hypothetical protein [Rhizobium rhizogenes]